VADEVNVEPAGEKAKIPVIAEYPEESAAEKE